MLHQQRPQVLFLERLEDEEVHEDEQNEGNDTLDEVARQEHPPESENLMCFLVESTERRFKRILCTCSIPGPFWPGFY